MTERDATAVEDVAFRVRGARVVTAEERFYPDIATYQATVYGTVDVEIDGESPVEDAHLPAEFDLVGTVRAQHGLLCRLDETGQATGEPFCCVCGSRGCAYLRWDLAWPTPERVTWTLTDLQDRPLGAGQYRCRPAILTDAVASLCETVLDVLDGTGVERLPWANDPPVDDRRYYGSVDELREQRETVVSIPR